MTTTVTVRYRGACHLTKIVWDGPEFAYAAWDPCRADVLLAWAMR